MVRQWIKDDESRIRPLEHEVKQIEIALGSLTEEENFFQYSFVPPCYFIYLHNSLHHVLFQLRLCRFYKTYNFNKTTRTRSQTNRNSIRFTNRRRELHYRVQMYRQMEMETIYN
mgnify:CR=1 FL=1